MQDSARFGPIPVAMRHPMQDRGHSGRVVVACIHLMQVRATEDQIRAEPSGAAAVQGQAPLGPLVHAAGDPADVREAGRVE
jgi:hypothetical protein